MLLNLGGRNVTNYLLKADTDKLVGGFEVTSNTGAVDKHHLLHGHKCSTFTTVPRHSIHAIVDGRSRLLRRYVDPHACFQMFNSQPYTTTALDSIVDTVAPLIAKDYIDGKLADFDSAMLSVNLDSAGASYHV